MRTREELIEELAEEINLSAPSLSRCESIARKYILEAEQRVRAEIGRDSERLDWLESGCCDVRFRSESIADTGDADVYCDIIQHHMAKPHERTIGSAETIRAAIDAAREAG